jgi:Tfp pilus assembly protein PilF
MMRPLLLFAIALCVVSPALAETSPLDDPSLPGGNRYDRCLDLAHSRPSEALAAANAWSTTGGGAAAIHCQAMSLVALRRYSEAAGKLDQLGHGNTAEAQRAQIYDQAGNAWLLAHQAANAEASFSSAISLARNDPDMLVDRARARAMLLNWSGAETDLTAALTLAPARPDILVLRSSARHAEGKKADARADIDQALAIHPGNPEALVERGKMKYEAGDVTGARSDWQQAASESGSDAADAARNYLQQSQLSASSTPSAATQSSAPRSTPKRTAPPKPVAQHLPPLIPPQQATQQPASPNSASPVGH